jgi:prophage antirepressor-like protein
MNQPQLFDFEGNGVRTLNHDEQIWFAFVDVAGALEIKNPADAIKSLDEDEVHRFNLGSRSGETNFISEPGLYKFIGASRKPAAKRFNRWVTHEVLPTIRKHGAYMTPETIEKTLTNPDFIIQLATQLKDEQAKTAALTADNEAMKPKAAYYDMILANSGLVPITSIAKNYGMSGQAFNSLLHDLGIQFKQSGCWYLYAKYQDKGYVHIEPVAFKHSDGREDVKPQMKWKQHGHKFLYDFLKKRGILPMIERQEMEVSK